jgi:hypothetical protein
MVDKVHRRIFISPLLEAALFKPNNWNKEEFKKFLLENKITNPLDVDFLRKEELKCFVVVFVTFVFIFVVVVVNVVVIVVVMRVVVSHCWSVLVEQEEKATRIICFSVSAAGWLLVVVDDDE